MTQCKINRLVIMGMGLIGGSLALSLREAKSCNTIIGYDCNEQQLKLALEKKAIDSYTLDAAKAASAADVIVIAVPIQATTALLEKIVGHLDPATIITDVGSVKGDVISAARQILKKQITRFVPGHPIAGTEKSGMAAAKSRLFAQHKVLLTPLPETDQAALSLICRMWEQCGADVSFIKAQHHDVILAATSHLPHLLAYALVDCLAHMQDKHQILQYAAGGLADFTRIAASNPQIWHDIFLCNRAQLLAALNQFNTHINTIKRAIEHGDSARLLHIFANANATRAQLTELNRSKTAPVTQSCTADAAGRTTLD